MRIPQMEKRNFLGAAPAVFGPALGQIIGQAVTQAVRSVASSPAVPQVPPEAGQTHVVEEVRERVLRNPDLEQLVEPKPWYMSKGFVANLVGMLLPLIAGIAGIAIDDSDIQLWTEGAMMALAFLGWFLTSALGALGRYKARRAITLSPGRV